MDMGQLRDQSHLCANKWALCFDCLLLMPASAWRQHIRWPIECCYSVTWLLGARRRNVVCCFLVFLCHLQLFCTISTITGFQRHGSKLGSSPCRSGQCSWKWLVWNDVVWWTSRSRCPTQNTMPPFHRPADVYWKFRFHYAYWCCALLTSQKCGLGFACPFIRTFFGLTDLLLLSRSFRFLSENNKPAV